MLKDINPLVLATKIREGDNYPYRRDAQHCTATICTMAPPAPKSVLGFVFGVVKTLFLLFYTRLLSPLIFPRQQIRDETPSPSSTTSAAATTPETSPEPCDEGEETNKGVENLYETLPERVAGEDDLEDEGGATASDAESASGEFPRQRRMAVKKKMLKQRSSAMDLIAQGSSNGRRSLWEELPEVKETGILGKVPYIIKDVRKSFRIFDPFPIVLVCLVMKYSTKCTQPSLLQTYVCFYPHSPLPVRTSFMNGPQSHCLISFPFNSVPYLILHRFRKTIADRGQAAGGAV